MSNELIRIGIITPTYERPALLDRMHRSLPSSNTAFEWRHYIVDDGSKADYSQIIGTWETKPDRFRYTRIKNGGPLIARNKAIEMAIADGCTHITFIDDDDMAMPGCIDILGQKAADHPDTKWFLFRSKKQVDDSTSWPPQAVVMSWFDDVVRKRHLGSDNTVLIRTDFVGTSRFSERGRSQREWLFLLGLAKKCDDILICPEIPKKIEYQADGLTAQSSPEKPSSEQIWNSVERAIQYWRMRPLSPALVFKAAAAVITAPLKMLKGAGSTSPR